MLQSRYVQIFIVLKCLVRSISNIGTKVVGQGFVYRDHGVHSESIYRCFLSICVGVSHMFMLGQSYIFEGHVMTAVFSAGCPDKPI